MMKFDTHSGKEFMSRLSYGEHPRPTRDWIILCCVFAAGFLLSALWNGWVFYRAVHGESIGSPTTLPVIETSEIEAAQRVFEERRIEQEKYEGEYHFVDPS